MGLFHLGTEGGTRSKWKRNKNTAYQQQKISVICHSLFDVVENASVYLEGQIMILLFLLGSQSIPPLPKDLADCPVVLVWVPLVHQCSVALTENHKCIHWSPDVILLPLKECARKMKRYYITRFYKRSIDNFDGQVGEVKDYLSRTVLISIFGQRTEGLSASLYWWCREGLLRYNSWEKAERRQKNSPLFAIFIRFLLGTICSYNLTLTLISVSLLNKKKRKESPYLELFILELQIYHM